jgi:hypothetical protein
MEIGDVDGDGALSYDELVMTAVHRKLVGTGFDVLSYPVCSAFGLFAMQISQIIYTTPQMNKEERLYKAFCFLDDILRIICCIRHHR